ncbi:MAG TPA: sigma-70 family RNA polymerase sigma factor [Anaeromyxobacteraceae bacterium]|nr:sigma-70 family RNA polymerase sigma factor [Anaeromyxobacteraceae bacterium]
MPMKDDVLLTAARAGDRDALEELLLRHQRSVFRFGMKMCGEEEDAKDVLQETLLAAARGIRDFRGTSSISTWLYTIARSFCVKRHRTSKFAPAQVESLDSQDRAVQQVPDTRGGPEEAAAGEQLRTALRQAIASLEPMYREVLVLRDVEGLPAAEVAEILELTVEAVKSRLHRARLAVRESIGPLLGAQAAAPGRDTCPDVVSLFSKHLEGEISSDVCARLEKHLEGCAPCRARCDSLRRTLSLCSHAKEEVPAHVERAVREALRRFVEQP